MKIMKHVALSYCIQDHPDDWAREAATMVDVYTNLLITISARDPDSCDKGYLGPQKFGDPDWQYAIPMEVPPSIATRPVSKILVRNGEVGVLRQYPLDSRGWCFQESVLPR